MPFINLLFFHVVTYFCDGFRSLCAGICYLTTPFGFRLCPAGNRAVFVISGVAGCWGWLLGLAAGVGKNRRPPGFSSTPATCRRRQPKNSTIFATQKFGLGGPDRYCPGRARAKHLAIRFLVGAGNWSPSAAGELDVLCASVTGKSRWPAGFSSTPATCRRRQPKNSTIFATQKFGLGHLRLLSRRRPRCQAAPD